MSAGIIWVSSRLAHPPPDQARAGVPVLTPERFCEWYENTHIQEVTALRGVPGAVRWEASTLISSRWFMPACIERARSKCTHQRTINHGSEDKIVCTRAKYFLSP